MLAISIAAVALASPNANDSLIRIVDTGPGLCCLIRVPHGTGFKYAIYDAGNRQRAANVLRAKIAEFIPEGSTIDLMVISHSDADHAGMVPEICEKYTVKRVIRPGLPRHTATWNNAIAAIENEPNCQDINLAETTVDIGKRFMVGSTTFRFVCGFDVPPDTPEWDIQGVSERNNAGSIVMRMIHKGRSVLFTGDAVGRHLNDPDPLACIATERFAMGQTSILPIHSRVLLAPHHGADNGSSVPFIQAVNPDYVIFSAGHEHEHPRDSAAQRYLDFGIPISNMFRTDRGDNEGFPEWAVGAVLGATDSPGDDDID
ncbi:MAG: MBL fold metallo-hydrolase, partial [Fimbriimonadales bacterium]